MPMKSPAKATVASVSCIANPIANPVITCSQARVTVAHDSVSGSDCLIVAAKRKATINASATFARAGMATELKGGAAANNAAVRRKGQKNSPSQRVISASLTVITRSPEGSAHRHCRALDIAGHLRRRPRGGKINDQHHRDKPGDEAQGQVVDPRSRLNQADNKTCEYSSSQKRGGEHQRHNDHDTRGRKDCVGAHRMNPSAREPITKVQPLTSTNSASFNGRETLIGDSSIIPSDIITAATTMSITKNGRKIINPI